MQLVEATRNIQKHLPNDTQQFTIAASSKAFKILSSNLYKNKPLAIIRELSCNAWDAHVAAGNETTPFEVKLPNDLHAELRIRDWGTGLAHEDVLDIYTTYFGSTKTKTNDQIGGLGLGSKTPFAYTDTYTVISRHQGIERTYTAYISEDGTPAITLMTEKETSEPNGLEVILPIKPADIPEFRKAAEQFLPRMPITPTVHGATIAKLDYVSENEIFRIRTGWDLPTAVISMGPVAYPIDSENLPHETKNKYSYILQMRGMEICANIGDVEIAPSREELSYDKPSIAKIELFLEKISNDLANHFIQKIAKAKTEFEAFELYCILFEQTQGFVRKLNLKWGNITFKENHARSILEKYPTLQLALLNYSNCWGYKRPKLNFSGTPYRISLRADQLKRIYVFDQPKKGSFIKKIEHNREALQDAVIIRGRKKDIKAFLKSIHKPKLLKFSDLPDAPITPRNSKPARQAKIKLLDRAYKPTEVEIDFDQLQPKEYMWVGMHGTDCINIDDSPIDRLHDTRKSLEHFLPGIPLYGIPRAHKKLEVTLPPESHFTTVVQATINRLVQTETTVQCLQTTKPSYEFTQNIRKLHEYFNAHIEKQPTSLMAHAYRAHEDAKCQRVDAHLLDFYNRTRHTFDWPTLRPDNLLDDFHHALQKKYAFAFTIIHRFWGNSVKEHLPEILTHLQHLEENS